jgi:hypothetical protein
MQAVYEVLLRTGYDATFMNLNIRRKLQANLKEFPVAHALTVLPTKIATLITGENLATLGQQLLNAESSNDDKEQAMCLLTQFSLEFPNEALWQELRHKVLSIAESKCRFTWTSTTGALVLITLSYSCSVQDVLVLPYNAMRALLSAVHARLPFNAHRNSANGDN